MHPLRSQWITYKAEHPRARTLDIAKALAVTEGELLASRIGDGAVRLRPDYKALVEGLKSVGRVMCLTRNHAVVHERYGEFLTVQANGPVGGVYGPDIDLRLFMSRWSLAIAAPVETRTGALDSIQIFDKHGTAAIKIYRDSKGDPDAWDSLVDSLTDTDQAPGWKAEPAAPPESVRPDTEVDAEALRAAWDALTDTHDFFGMLRAHSVSREQALRLAGPERATPLHIDALESVLNEIARRETVCMVFVGSPGCVQIHSGKLHKIAWSGSWLNVLDPDFNLHIDTSHVESAWLVRKPTDNGPVHSLEVYDGSGALLVQIFGKRTEGESQAESWHELLDDVAVEQPFLVGPTGETPPSEAADPR